MSPGIDTFRWFEIKSAIVFSLIFIGTSLWAYYNPTMRVGPGAALVVISFFGMLAFGVGRAKGDG